MKKVLSHILILVIVFTNLFAPISVGLGLNNKIEIKKNVINAANDIDFKITPAVTGTSIQAKVSIISGDPGGGLYTLQDSSSYELEGSLIDPSGEMVGDFNEEISSQTLFPLSISFKNLKPLTLYKLNFKLLEVTEKTSMSEGMLLTVKTGSETIGEKTIPVSTVDENTTTPVEMEATELGGSREGEVNKPTDPTLSLPSCNIFTNFTGCIAQATYYALFVPTSYLFALAGVFFDNTFAYSVQDSSYRSSFVVEGWGLIRDFCNMFFIFILLYVAVGTILNLHSVKTKETIINIVIIGLFINFSLFATQIIIDMSNVTARVFYNSDAIKVTVEGQTDNTFANATDGGTVLAEEKEGGVIELSAALVNKVNPQNLILRRNEISNYKAKGTSGSAVGEKPSSMDAGQFILITLMAVGINVIGFIVFLSVGLIFISRVIGLWLAMILSPLAFFTYILPEMSGTKMIGWRNWWPETLKLAFLAPIFIFFLYIILKFLELDLITDASSKTGLDFFIATIIPFAFIMILLMKAKSIAKDMSGEMGQQITGGISAIGGMALGGAALGAAALGRGLIKNPLKMMTSSEATRNAALKNFSVFKPSSYGKAISAKMGGAFNSKSTATKEGSNMLRDQLLKNKKTAGEKSHAQHLLDESADKISKGSKYSDLDADQQKKAKGNVDREEASRALFGKGSDTLDSTQARDLARVFNANGDIDTALLRTIATSLNRGAQGASFHDSKHLEQKYNERGPGIGANTLNSIATGSYDVRNTKMTGIMSPLGGAMKLGLSSLGMSAGKAQGDFLKDLTQTLKESITNISKTIKVDVKMDSSHSGGGSHGGDDSHGGGHH